MGHAIEHFAIPSLAPEPVRAASEKFEAISAELQTTRAKMYALRTSRLDDIAAANRAAAEARIEGTKPPTLTAAKIEANLAKAEEETSTLHEATDLAHTTLAESIDAHREEWLDTLDRVAAEAVERLRVALLDARAAVDDLKTARHAPEWLRSFKVSASQTQYPGGRGIAGAGALDTLDAIVEAEQRLVGYRDDDGDGTAEAIWEDVTA
jgi:hypothetical protein